MRKVLQVVGLYLVLAGISGTIDHLYVQPLLGVILNAFNRFVLPHLDALDGYEVAANLSLSALGAIVLAVSGLVKKS
ncbi:MAG: hypothetical protein ACRD0P_19145 [Stackebrandtia sp.]